MFSTNILKDVLDTNINTLNDAYYANEFTFRRMTAISLMNRGINVGLIRPGNKFFDGLDLLSDLDDRGRTFSILRTVKDVIPKSEG